MDSNNWRVPIQGQVIGGDWRAQLQPESRQKLVNKITITLKRHLPFSGQEGAHELNKMAVTFEENIYIAAKSQSEYLRKISYEMLTMETKSQIPMSNSLQSNAASNNINPQDPEVNFLAAMASVPRLRPKMETCKVLTEHTPSKPKKRQLDMDSNNLLAAKKLVQVQGQVIGSNTVAACSMEGGDWRPQLHAESRQRIVNKITESLKRHFQFSGQEGLQELNKVAVRFEERIYTEATSQSDYLRKISLKMLTMETKSQIPVSNSLQSNAASNYINPQDLEVNFLAAKADIPRIRPEMEMRKVLIEHTTSTPEKRQLNMDSNNLQTAQKQVPFQGQVIGSDWRTQLPTESRQRIVNKIMVTLKRHRPFSGHGVQELNKMAVTFEESVYIAAKSQSEYLRKISSKMLTMESKSQNPMSNSLQSNAKSNNINPKIQR